MKLLITDACFKRHKRRTKNDNRKYCKKITSEKQIYEAENIIEIHEESNIQSKVDHEYNLIEKLCYIC